MMKEVNPLSLIEIESLKENFEILTFENSFDIVYENQIPCVGVALIEGSIEIIKNSKIKHIYDSFCLIGAQELMQGLPIKYGLRIRGNSKIIALGKKAIYELMIRRGQV